MEILLAINLMDTVYMAKSNGQVEMPPRPLLGDAAGAGFLVPIAGAMMRLPGLPAVPAALHIDIDDNGVISGLS